MEVPRFRTASGSTGPSGSVDIPGSSSVSHGSARVSASSRSRRERERSGRPKDRHFLALKSIRDFLRGRSSYDVLPVSFRLIVLDTKLVVKPALDVMWQAGVVSAPLWQSTPHELLGNPQREEDQDQQAENDSVPQEIQSPTDISETSVGDAGAVSPKHAADEAARAKAKAKSKAEAKAHQMSGFAGMLTVNDIIHLIQYYYHHSSYDSAAQDVEKFRLERLRDIEQALNVPPPPLLSVHPLRPLFDACQLLIKTHARRLPLLDYDEQTGMETVVSVLTQYRVLKFIAMNCRETSALWRSLRQLGIGTYCHSFKPNKGNTSTVSSHRGSDASEPGIVKTDHGQILGMSEIEPDAQTSGTPAVPDESQTGDLRRESDASVSSSSSSASNSRPTSATTATTPGSTQRSPQPESDSSNPYAPLATATLDTTVFDVVHMFSERGISAVPILDEEGNVVDMYETVDVITLVRTGAYTALDLTIRQALERRPPDFGGVWTCSPDDSLASIFALLRKRRVHRLLVLEPEPLPAHNNEAFKSDKTAPLEDLDSYVDDLVEDEKAREREEREKFINDPRGPLDDRLEKGDPVRKSRGRLIGMVCLSDILRYVIGDPSLASDDANTGASSAALRRESSSASASARSRGASIASSSASNPSSSIPQTMQYNSADPTSQSQSSQTQAQTASTTTNLDATQTIPEEEVLDTSK